MSPALNEEIEERRILAETTVRRVGLFPSSWFLSTNSEVGETV